MQYQWQLIQGTSHQKLDLLFARMYDKYVCEWVGWCQENIPHECVNRLNRRSHPPSKSPGQSQQDAQAAPTLVALITLITLVGVNRMRKQHQPLNTVGDQEVAERECWSLERVLS